ncbi:MAG: hypothetical protein IJ524_09900 [Bacteroidales bacterium]|nr:hypothetical protein [Bacteroidales bacterium]
MRESVAKNIMVNIRAFFTVNIRRRLNDNSTKISRLESIIDTLDETITERYHYLNLLDYYAHHEDEAQRYQKELDYLQQRTKYCNFPYNPDSTLINVISGHDQEAKLPYVIHKNKKLFFKAAHTPLEAVDLYRNYLVQERLLGDDYCESAPHQYQSPNIHVEKGDVLFDIGAAEGLFALDQIDKASHVVIVESDPEWIEPLKHTFAPYGSKVTILQKFVSATDTETTISLGTLLSDVEYNSAFIKMDIEGHELSSVVSATSVLKQKKGTKLSVASYHKQHDAEELKAFFENIGYHFEFSTGYMLFHLYDTPAPPYFRHGIIRTRNSSL